MKQSWNRKPTSMRRYALHYSTVASFQVWQNKEPNKPVGIAVMVFTIDEKKVVNIAGKHDADIADVLLPDDIPRGLKFCEDKEEYFRKPNAELMISTLRLTDFFYLVIIGGKCEHPKPAPDPYLKALEILNVSKEHAFICELLDRMFDEFANLWMKMKIQVRTKEELDCQQYRFKPREMLSFVN
ncbi:haloacid dehalogenase-like hydrolase domain-containing protein Sgpp [Tanacetum coccineum]|uniref:Haloacid dehalogenase-like hydrolase domain-containing protein Sgpp n=1 Tax=Tanacetum coccineum TaxID=301880 RepID=A0ABQ5ED90_9ASTR